MQQEQEPVTARDVKAVMAQRGDTLAKMAARWNTFPSNISRVINRTPRHRQDGIRKKLARYLGVTIDRVGRTNGTNGTKARSSSKRGKG